MMQPFFKTWSLSRGEVHYGYVKSFTMKTIITIFLIAAIPGLLSECSYAQQTTSQHRAVTGFNSVEVSGGINLYLTQGNSEGAEVIASGNVIDKIRTEVEDGVLKIHLEKGAGIFSHTGPMKVNVSFRQLEAVSAGGGSDVYLQNGIRSARLAFSMSGGSDLKGRVSAGELRLSLSGGSDADLSGTAGTLAIHASGGSNVNGYGLVTDNCSVDNGGGSDVYITVNKLLNVSASGGSDVYYKGSASMTNVSASGGSEVKRKE